MKNALVLLSIITTYFVGFGQNFNRPAPNNTGQYEFQRLDTTTHNKYYLFAPFTFSGAGLNLLPKMLYIIDEDGYIAWWSEYSKKQFDFKYHPASDEYLFTRKATTSTTTYHFQMDNSFNLVDSVTAVNGVSGDIHEFQVFPNGNRCILASKDSLMDLSSLIFNGSPGSSNTTVEAAVIQEFDPSGNLVFEWNSLDHISPDHFSPNLTYNANSFDYVHANAIEMDSDGNLLLSLRAADMICKIDHLTGNVIWKFGGNFSDFTLSNDPGFFGQHDIRVLPNGNLSIFDNDYPTNLAARGTEYQIDTAQNTALLVNESTYPFDFSARSLGSFRVLDNDYRLAGWGNTSRPSPSVTLFDPIGNIASDFFFRDTVVTYRAFFQSLPSFPSRPEINCQPFGSELELSVSGTHNSYLWSTGETTTTIVINQPGTYQCWVDQGIGMLGSYAVTITNISSCDEIGIDEIKPNSSEIVGYIDIMGREIESAPQNQVYFIQYTDGSVQRHFSVLPE